MMYWLIELNSGSQAAVLYFSSPSGYCTNPDHATKFLTEDAAEAYMDSIPKATGTDHWFSVRGHLWE
jgi:hypothetical protein